MKTQNIKADVIKDILPDAKDINSKYSMEQIKLLFAMVKALKTKTIKES